MAVAGSVYKIGSVCPSVHQAFRLAFCLSGGFFGTASLIFSKFCHGARKPYEVVPGRAGLSRKMFPPIIGKMDPKWFKNRVFSIYWSIWSLIFPEFNL